MALPGIGHIAGACEFDVHLDSRPIQRAPDSTGTEGRQELGHDSVASDGKLTGETAVDPDDLAGDVAGSVRAEEDRKRADVAG